MTVFEEPVSTPSDVAAQLGVKYPTIMQWIKEGRLQAYKMGGRYFVADASVAAIVQKIN
jgi:excisionase family DNA binding protein